MARSISIVEYKVEQAHFFLEQIETSEHNFFAVRCFTDAFTSACRTITFSMQAVVADVDGFQTWYAERIELLKKDRVSNFFNAYRVASVHIGETVVSRGASFTGKDGILRRQYFFMPIPGVPSVPTTDVLTTCRAHFVNLLTVVYDAFVVFRDQLDDRWYYTEANFNRLGKSFKDALADFGLPEQFAAAASVLPETARWRALRSAQTVGCQINALFDRYLGKTIAGPDAG
jgi:hypothetical protein